ncbi:putative quinol monooxygenase [Maridesulfovibrio sp.]|uniref:putative quinol monooxygenase n=1 Tax=Maridesulfovibrio sp. TaxID=2795000 RepID=UPI002A18A6B8|nr:putative quinol monooxygenase [Maridesulfovibrio sp.]
MYCGNPFIRTVRLKAAEGCMERLRTILRNAVESCAGQEGILVYFLHQERNNPDTFMLYEQFSSDASFRMYLDSAALRKTMDEASGMLAGDPQVEIWGLLEKKQGKYKSSCIFTKCRSDK